MTFFKPVNNYLGVNYHLRQRKVRTCISAYLMRKQFPEGQVSSMKQKKAERIEKIGNFERALMTSMLITYDEILHGYLDDYIYLC